MSKRSTACTPLEGVDNCFCGSKYWDWVAVNTYVCHSCGEPFQPSLFDADETPAVTKSGRVLTNADFEALAEEAERGYDVSHLTNAAVRNLLADTPPSPSLLPSHLPRPTSEEPTMTDDIPRPILEGRRTRMPSQASLIDQLTELRRVANRLGLYDAADFLTNGVLADYESRTGESVL